MQSQPLVFIMHPTEEACYARGQYFSPYSDSLAWHIIGAVHLVQTVYFSSRVSISLMLIIHGTDTGIL